MSLTELAAIGNFVSGMAVFVSFVFLALQLRQANRNQRSLMQHGRSARTRDVFMRYTDPGVTSLVLRAFEADPTLSDAEYFAFYSLAGAVFVTYEDSFRQFRAGAARFRDLAVGQAHLGMAAVRSRLSGRPGGPCATASATTIANSSILSWRTRRSSR